MKHEQKIIILDFGSQYTQLIARKVREIEVYAEIYPFNISQEKFDELVNEDVDTQLTFFLKSMIFALENEWQNVATLAKKFQLM